MKNTSKDQQFWMFNLSMRIYPAWAGRKRGTDLVIKTNIIFDCYPLKYPIKWGKYQIISGKYKGISENIQHIDKYQHIIEISEHACSKRLKFCSIYQKFRTYQMIIEHSPSIAIAKEWKWRQAVSGKGPTKNPNVLILNIHAQYLFVGYLVTFFISKSLIITY